MASLGNQGGLFAGRSGSSSEAQARFFPKSRPGAGVRKKSAIPKGRRGGGYLKLDDFSPPAASSQNNRWLRTTNCGLLDAGNCSTTVLSPPDSFLMTTHLSSLQAL